MSRPSSVLNYLCDLGKLAQPCGFLFCKLRQRWQFLHRVPERVKGAIAVQGLAHRKPGCMRGVRPVPGLLRELNETLEPEPVLVIALFPPAASVAYARARNDWLSRDGRSQSGRAWPPACLLGSVLLFLIKIPFSRSSWEAVSEGGCRTGPRGAIEGGRGFLVSRTGEEPGPRVLLTWQF